jgi:lipid II:glycine glycyltransferase (peptidoglycan interpeptide bridge formation enzyme)
MSLALAYDEMFIAWAVHDRRTVAAILVLVHGKTASYRIGWTTSEGRECHAHNLLLWSAVKELKKRGVSFFDLAGVEPGSEGGLSHFKRGLGGVEYKTLGVFS